MHACIAETCWATPEDHAVCRALIRGGSKSFFAASLLLPTAVRQSALALYAFCRLADDSVDNGCQVDAVSLLRERLTLVYSGRPAAAPADRAFADVVHRYAIPKALTEALLEGFVWDREFRRYEDEEQLTAYAARVAGSVGAMMACLMERRSPQLVARACDLGVAMQFTNIARDVGEDARAGRLYLPLSWLREAGVDVVEWMRRPQFGPGVAAVVARLLAAADLHYERAGLGIRGLPRDCQRAVRAARFLYAQIGHELRRTGLDSVSQRTVVPTGRKLAVLAQALCPTPNARHAVHPAALSQTQFLVDAVCAAGVYRPRSIGARAPYAWELRVEWLVALFERLERRDRSQPDRLI